MDFRMARIWIQNVAFNFTFLSCSEKLIHTKTHFLSHFARKKDIARPGFEPVIFQSEGKHTNHHTMGT